MTSVGVETAGSVLLWAAIKASVLLGIAALCQATILRRSAAATRHLVWVLTIVTVLALPAASVVLPTWAVPGYVASTPVVMPAVPDIVDEPAPVASSTLAAAGGAGESAPPEVEPAPISWSAITAAVYACGFCLSILWFAFQLAAGRRLERRADRVTDAAWTRLLVECSEQVGVRRRVALLRSREQTMPVVLGARNPSIVMPSIADLWDDERRRAVMLHELAHVARHDYVVQMLAAAACAMYWFHPGVWWVARRLLIEREIACDDRVIAAGAEARAYAGHLLEIAYSMGGAQAPALAVGMARRHQLEGRLMAALDTSRNRRVPARRVILVGAASATALLVALAGARPAAEPRKDPTPEFAAQAPGPDPSLAPRIEALRAVATTTARDAVRRAAKALGLPQPALPGTWEIRPTDTPGVVHLRLVEDHSSTGTNVRIDQLDGLTASQLASADGPVRFRIRRDAGTFSFDGVMHSGVGAGTFSFAADPNFPSELAKRGFARPTSSEQYELARSDIGFAFVDELTKQGYEKPPTSELVRAGQHGVSLPYLREMGALGHRFPSLEALVVLRDHGVTPSYIRELSELGYKDLSTDGLRNARDHGITPEYVSSMRDLGFGTLTMPELINARDHGISVEFARAMAADGHGKLPLDQLIRIRDHGVTPDYMRDMRQLGYSLSIDDFVRARDHGISVDVVRDMAALGYSGVPIDALIRARDHGVSPDYVRDLKGLGYERLPLDDLIVLRDHGLNADRIRSANAKAGSRLPVDVLKSLVGR